MSGISEPSALRLSVRRCEGSDDVFHEALDLPATSDIAVFNAIFKSLRENLLR